VLLARKVSLRVLYGVFSLLFISFVTFVIQSFASGDVATILAGEKASPMMVEHLRHQLGLDRPLLVQYFDFLWKALHGDLGHSYFSTQQSVVSIIAQNLPMTMEIASIAIVLSAIIGILFGTIAAVYEERSQDWAILSLSTLGVTIPTFVLAPILVYIYSLRLDELPQTWEIPLRDAEWKYLLLPVIILAARPTASIIRLTRSSMVETLRQEFIRMAVAKGVPRGSLIFKHALRNAILPVVTSIGTNFGYLLSGSFIIERFFRLPGIGAKTIEAMQQRDTPVIQGCIIATGALFVLVNLIVDLSVPLLDPRVRDTAL